MNSISVYVLNALNSNITLTVCDTSKLRKHKVALSIIVDKHIPFSGTKRFIFQRWGFLLPLLSAVMLTLAGPISKKQNMLRKIYLVPAEDDRPTLLLKGGRRERREKLHQHDEWIKLLSKYRDSVLWRNAHSKAIANFMKVILPIEKISEPAATTTQTHRSLILRRNRDVGRKPMWRRVCYRPTNTYVLGKSSYTRLLNVNQSENLIMKMKVITIFSRRRQRSSVETSLAL